MKVAIVTRVTAVFTASMLIAAPLNPIGAVNAVGDFRVNGIHTIGHATLSEGATLETSTATGDINLSGGTHVVLGKDAQAHVYSDRLQLVHGSVQFEHSGQYSLDVQDYRVQPLDSSSSIVVTTTEHGVRVGALSGKARLSNAEGKLLAWVPQGTALEVGGRTDRSTVMKMKGKLFVENGKYYIVDNTTGLKVQLLDDDLAKLAGKTVEVVGSTGAATPATGIAYVITVTSIHAAAGAAIGAGVIIAGVALAAGGTVLGVVVANGSKPTLSQ